MRAPQGTDSTAFVPLPTRREGNAVIAQTEHFSDFLAVVATDPVAFGTCTDGVCATAESCDTCPADCGLCFETGDHTPPSFVALEAPLATTNVRGDAVVTVRFSEIVMPSSVSTASVALSAAGVPVAGTFATNDAVVTFTPSVPLLPATTYTLRITGVRDFSGNVMAAVAMADFTTGTATAVSTLLPANGATGVGVFANFDLIFGADIALASITGQATGGPCTGSVQVSTDAFATCVATRLDPMSTNSAIGLDPILQLPGNTAIQVRFSPAARDVNGFSLAQLPAWSFTTGADTNPPMLIGSDPADTSEIDPRTFDSFVLTFSEPIDPSSVNGSTVVLTDTEVDVPCNRSVSGNVVTLTPTVGLALNWGYEVQLSNIRDLVGNDALTSLPTLQFQTAFGNRVVDSYPYDYDVGVHPRADIDLTYGSPLAQSTITMQATDSATCSGTIRLTDGTTCYGGTITFTTASSFTIRASTSLPYLTRIYVVAAAGATSMDGLELPLGDQIQFIVSPDDTFALAFFGAYPQNSALGGVSGADATCSDNRVGGNAKAFLMTATRYACATAWCGTDSPGSEADTSMDWVLRPATTYVNPSGDPMFVTHAIAPIPAFGVDLANAIGSGIGSDVYFGGNQDWTHAVGHDCVGYTDNDAAFDTTLVNFDTTSGTAPGGWLDGGTDSCDVQWALGCVEQPPAVPHPTH